MTNRGTNELSLNPLVTSKYSCGFYLKHRNSELERVIGSSGPVLIVYRLQHPDKVHCLSVYRWDSRPPAIARSIFCPFWRFLSNTEQKMLPWDFYPLGHYMFTNGVQDRSSGWPRNYKYCRRHFRAHICMCDYCGIGSKRARKAGVSKLEKL